MVRSVMFTFVFIFIYINSILNVNAFSDWQLRCLESKWYSKFDTVLLLSIKDIECNRDDWRCVSTTNDFWFYQINLKWHKEKVEKSLSLWNNKYDLFEYQSSTALNMIQHFKCWQDLMCIWGAYNWSKKYWYRLQKKFNDNYIKIYWVQ